MKTWIAGMTLLAAACFAQTASAQADRGGRWETRLGLIFQDSTDASFDGGTTASIDSDTGFRVGWKF